MARLDLTWMRKTTGRRAVAGVLGLCLLAYGVWVLSGWYRTTQIPESKEVASLVVTTSSEQPSEAEPTEPCEHYASGNTSPKAIEIPSVGIDSCVQRVGIDQNNAVAVPSNVHLAGWFVNSPAPGEVGVSVIDGHVRGTYREGIFSRLHELKPKDKVRIEAGNNTWNEFEVVDTVRVSPDDAGTRLFSAIVGVKRQLNLITCIGNYDENLKTYEERVVVRTKLVSSTKT